MLAIAHAFETFGGLAPCILCLQQRTVYWAAMAIAAAGVAARYTPVKMRADRLFLAALAIVFLVGMGIAIRQAGAEWKWWPGPAACAANRVSVSLDGGAAVLTGPAVVLARGELDAGWWRSLDEQPGAE